VSPCTTNKRAFGAEGTKFVPDATTCFQSQTCLKNTVQNPVHGVANNLRHGAVNQTGGWLILTCPCIGHDTTCRGCTILKCPQKLFFPFFLIFFFYRSQRFSYSLVGILYIFINRITVLILQLVLLFPDFIGCGL